MSDQNLKFTPEQLKAARAAKTPEELIAAAKKQGVEITKEQADRFLNPSVSELADEELDNVAGGGCGSPSGPSDWVPSQFKTYDPPIYDSNGGCKCANFGTIVCSFDNCRQYGLDLGLCVAGFCYSL